MISSIVILIILFSTDSLKEDTIIRFDIPLSRIAAEESYIRMAIKAGIVRDRPLISLKPEELKPVKFERTTERLIPMEFLPAERRDLPSLVEDVEMPRIEIRPREELVRIEMRPEVRDEKLIDEDIEVLRMDVLGVLKADEREHIPLISTAISYGTVPIKMRAIEALKREDDPIAIPLLKEALDDSEWRVRLQSAGGLARRGEEIGYEELHSALMREEPEPKSEAARVLGEIGDVSSLPELRRYVSHRSPKVRKQAIIALGMMKDRSSILLIESALLDREEEVRAAATRVLGEIGDASVLPSLKRVMLNDESPVVRVFAAEAILRIEKK